MLKQQLMIGRSFREFSLKRPVRIPIELLRASYPWPRVESPAAISGGVLSSIARFPFTSKRHAATKTNTIQLENSEWQTVG